MFALHDFKPVSFHEAKGEHEHSEFPYTWIDIGGMQNIKMELEQMFLWPSKVIYF